MRTLVRNQLHHLLVALLAVVVAGCGGGDSEGPVDVQDTTPPSVSSVKATDVDRAEVVFSERVEKASAETASNYVLVETTISAVSPQLNPRLPWQKPHAASPGDSVRVFSATLQGDGRTVALTTERMDPFAPYDLHVAGVMDMSGNAMPSKSRPVVNEIQSGRIFTIAGTGLPALGGEDIDPLLSELYLPQDVTVGPGGLLYILDWNNHRIRVIENGLIRTVVGTGLLGDAQPGNALEVGLNHPTNITFDVTGAMYVAAWHNSKILKVDMSTGVLSIFCAFAGARGFFGDGGKAYDAILNLPSSVVFDRDGNLYISDQANFRIRVIDTNDIINTTVNKLGRWDYCGDGGLAIDACLKNPSGQNALPAGRIALDANGNLYIADTSNHRVRVVTTNGIINTVVGNGIRGFSGDNGAAKDAMINWPADVAIGPNGNLYIADRENHAIRRVDTQGVITTVAGMGGVSGFGGDGGRATEAQLKEPFGITLDSAGNLYIADTKNHRIRVVYR